MSATVEACALPADALLCRYAEQGAYVDCFRCEVDIAIGLDQFVHAFYTSPVFRLERWILALAVRRPSCDEQITELLVGKRDDFAAWHLDARNDRQLLMLDMHGRTCSWFSCQPPPDGAGSCLYFGSGVLVLDAEGKGRQSGAGLFRALLGFHKLYSRILLSSAARRLEKAAVGSR